VDAPLVCFVARMNLPNIFCSIAVVAQQVWGFVYKFFVIDIISGFDDICAFWHLAEKNSVLNLVIPSSLWSMWKLRNEFCFQGRTWRSVKCRSSATIHKRHCCNAASSYWTSGVEKCFEFLGDEQGSPVRRLRPSCPLLLKILDR